LILSSDDIPERITASWLTGMPFIGGGQNFEPNPDKLFFKRNRLCLVKNGKLVKKKKSGIFKGKKWPPYYIRDIK